MKQIDELKRDVAKLLRSIERSNGDCFGDPVCPSCGSLALKGSEHSPGCALNAMIERCEGEP